MSTCVPVFPLPPQLSPAQEDHLDDDETISVDVTGPGQPGYIAWLSERYHALAPLPFILAPPSRPGSPAFTARALKHHERLTRAIQDAQCNSSDPKWAHVTKLVRMAATSRRQGAAPGVRVGEKIKVDCGDYEFVLPDTEEEWEECERRWAARKLTGVSTASGSGEGKGKERERETKSRYWPDGAAHKTKPPTTLDLLAEGALETKEDRVTDKVRSWQATVVSAEHLRASPSETPAEVAVFQSRTGTGKSGPKQKRQSPLDFPVVNHAGLSTTTKTQGSKRAKSPVANRSGSPVVDFRMFSPPRHKTPEPHRASSHPLEMSSPLLGIADISESDFLPPSFPSHLETSTPKDPAPVEPNNHAKRKPPPIYPRPYFSSSPPSPPLSTWSLFDPARPARKSPQPLVMSSSLPAISPTAHVRANAASRPQKRTRPLTPPDDDVFLSVHKKQRIEMTQAQRQESSAPPPPSSPPPVDTPALSKSTSPLQPALMGKPSSSSGHSLNLPVLETPKRKELPTLTDLLASSRKSKTRPRPPSRKLSSPAVDVTISSNYPNQHEAETRHNVLPVLLEDASVPDISPAKTYFSSPASGSAHSTPEHRRPRSPISPLFGTGGGNISMNMNISHFSPPFTSTQHGHGHEPGSGSSQYGGLGGESQRGHGLVRGSSGLFGMYNSQFDVEAQVGQVSDLLDRDVDFGEYLKDVDEDEEQEGKEEIAA